MKSKYKKAVKTTYNRVKKFTRSKGFRNWASGVTSSNDFFNTDYGLSGGSGKGKRRKGSEYDWGGL